MVTVRWKILKLDHFQSHMSSIPHNNYVFHDTNHRED